jgi:hypothetical protein
VSARGTPSRPIALLDVDGVLFATPPRRGRPPRPTAARAGRRAAEIDPRYAAWLRELAEHYDLAWASSWGRLAAEVIGPSLGLPASIPVVALTTREWQRTRKLPDVARFVGDRPCAWVDGHLGTDAFAWARERAVPTLLLRTDPRVGLQRRHLQQLLLFASAVRGAWVADPRAR